jgi:hypothetical protein
MLEARGFETILGSSPRMTGKSAFTEVRGRLEASVAAHGPVSRAFGAILGSSSRALN